MKTYNGESWFRLAYVCAETNVPTPTLKYWIRTKSVQGRKFGLTQGSPWYIPESEIIRIKEQNGTN